MKILRKVDRAIAVFEEHTLSICVCVMTIVLIYNVAARYIFKSGVGWSEEIGKLCMVVATYLGLSYVTRIARHINMTIVTDRLNKKGQRIFQIYMNFITAVMFLFLTFYAFTYAINYVMPLGRVTTNLRIPVYLMVLLMAIGFLLTAYRFFYIGLLNVLNKEEVYFSSDHTGPVVDEDYVEICSVGAEGNIEDSENKGGNAS
ncbi:MAG TPA: TRAP transporter small permease [Bacillota bacterium]|nr:TRAP transporter small permease [Bacillota bacterium]HPL54137.1 TRAP transporter small permease [Bacillota bacterium]